MRMTIDQAAKDNALHRWGLPECLHVPIAAIDEGAISTCVGNIVQVLAEGTPNQAFLVEAKDAPPIDARLPIWELQASQILFAKMQIWVHVKYGRYRAAYKRAFPDDDISEKVLGHVLNRRDALFQGFEYVRIIPISRGSNSSSGFSENWGVALHRTAETIASAGKPRAFIHYADLCALMLMMDMKVGGGVMEIVNEAQRLVRPRSTREGLVEQQRR